jgi:hypothetical protein
LQEKSASILNANSFLESEEKRNYKKYLVLISFIQMFSKHTSPEMITDKDGDSKLISAIQPQIVSMLCKKYYLRIHVQKFEILPFKN